MYDQLDCTFTNSEIESNYNQKGSKLQGVFSDQDSVDSMPIKLIQSKENMVLKRRKTEKDSNLKQSFKSDILAAQKAENDGLTKDVQDQTSIQFLQQIIAQQNEEILRLRRKTNMTNKLDMHNNRWSMKK